MSRISKFAKTPGGAELIFNQDFDTEPDVLNYKKDLVSDWKALLESDLKGPEFYFPEIMFINKLKKQGTVLEGLELADSAAFMKSSFLMKKFCLKEPENLSLSGRLREEASLLPELNDYADNILKELNPDGSVKENHPLLKSARARIAALHKQISRISSTHLNENREIWQSPVPSQRDGRTVLAIKTNYRGRIKGLVHELSSSGATVFIEPFDLVDLNNDFTYEQSQLNQQIIKIYRGLTDRLREASETFEQLVNHVYILDTYFARARFSIRNRCIRPLEAARGILIIKGRHPLLDEKAVPISLKYDDDIIILIITGPNAGGKTVTLKTCGLFVLMNQFACELPAEEGTAVCLYDNVFADIGDDQSIEESLSTFSGHMTRISGILDTAGQHSLILLDELGSGTDPSQGSAIAMGVLEHLRENGTSTIVTTHHAAVKNFGYTHKGAVNASVAFDSVTMRPTYEIVQGVPGESHAIEIAQSCGLSGEIIKKAEGYMENGDATVSGMIKELEVRQYELIGRDRKMKQAETALKEERRSFDLSRLKLRQTEHNIKNAEYGDLRRYVNDSRKLLENLVRELREGEITREKTTMVKDFIKNLEQQLDGEREKMNSEESRIDELKAKACEIEDLAADTVLESGMTVRYLKTNKEGILIEQRKKDQWITAFGNIKLNISASELRPVAGRKVEKQSISVSSSGFDASPAFELDLRGMRVYEAEAAVMRQIDSALLSGISEFSIIHGLGEGILQKAVHDYLHSCGAVKKFSFSDPDQGGFGKTIVKL